MLTNKPFVIYDKLGHTIPILLKQIMNQAIPDKVNIAIRHELTGEPLLLDGVINYLNILEVVRLFPCKPFLFLVVGEFEDEFKENILRTIKIFGAKEIIKISKQ